MVGIVKKLFTQKTICDINVDENDGKSKNVNQNIVSSIDLVTNLQYDLLI